VVVGKRANQTVAAAPKVDTVIGMKLAALETEELEQLDLEHGVRVTNVEADGLAAKAGLVEGDVVVKFYGVDATSVDQVLATAQRLPIGKPIPILVNRSGRSLFVTLRLAETLE